MLDDVTLGDRNRSPNEKRWTFEVRSGFVSSSSTVADSCIAKV